MLSAHSCPVGNLGAKDTGGMSVYIRELARELGKQGHLVDIYTRVHDPKDPQIVDLGHSVRLIHLRAGDDEEMLRIPISPCQSAWLSSRQDRELQRLPLPTPRVDEHGPRFEYPPQPHGRRRRSRGPARPVLLPTPIS